MNETIRCIDICAHAIRMACILNHRPEFAGRVAFMFGAGCLWLVLGHSPAPDRRLYPRRSGLIQTFKQREVIKPGTRVIK